MPASGQSHASGSFVETSRTPSPLVVAPPTSGSVVNDPHSEEEEAQELEKELAEGMQKLSMHSPPLRYHGKSSGLVLIRSAMALKNEYSGLRPPPKGDGQQPVSANRPYSGMSPSNGGLSGSRRSWKATFLSSKRTASRLAIS